MGSKTDAFNIIDKLNKLDGMVVGDLMMPANQTLSKDDRSAVKHEVAIKIGQKEALPDDLKELVKEFNITNEDIISEIVLTQVKAVLG